MDTRPPSTERSRRRQRGLSLVELMTGTALGLFIASGAISLFAGQLGSARRLMLEARVQQDLRSAADLMTRELRRSGYWGAAESGVWHGGAVAVATNPYTAVSPAASGVAATEVNFGYSRYRNAAGTVEGRPVTDFVSAPMLANRSVWLK